MLTEHLDDWKSSVEAVGSSSKQAAQQHSRATKLLVGKCRFRRWSELDSGAVRSALGAMAERGLSNRTVNGYQQAANQFCRWMVREGRADTNPLEHVSRRNEQADIRYRRRALSPEECGKLMKAARNGVRLQGLDGPERALLYRTALETGLRMNELKTLRVRNLDLDATPPILTVEACNSKHRR
jgi:site-specific recombinase XerC